MASRIPPAQNADSLANSAHMIRFRGAAMAAGRSIIATKQKNMIPRSVADKRIPTRKMKLRICLEITFPL
jgi:hypothetical protein